MAKACGSQFLFQIDDEASPGTLISVSLCVSNGLAGSNDLVDVTDKGSAHAREILDNCGTQAFSVSGEGQMNDSLPLSYVHSAFLSQALVPVGIISGLGDSYEFMAKITAFERNAAHNEAEAFSFTAESSGAITYTPTP